MKKIGETVKARETVAVTEFESAIIQELNQERLNQSRTIAKQLDTIGKLKEALGQMTERTFHRPYQISTCIIPEPTSISPTGLCSTAVQSNTHVLLENENRRLVAELALANSALSRERAKSSRIATVFSRLASPLADNVLSSPDIAKWVVMGLEDSNFFSNRARTGTFDDSFVPSIRRPGSCVSDITFTSRRRALSEGNTPVAGLDLDMMYGSFGGEGPDVCGLSMSPRHSIRMQNAADVCGFSLSPRHSIRMQNDSKYWDGEVVRLDNLPGSEQVFPDESLVGTWWTGFGWLELELFSDSVGGRWGHHFIHVYSTAGFRIIAHITGEVYMVGTRGENRIVWGNGQRWEHT